MWKWLVDHTKRVLKDIASFHGSPTQVARGAAVGTFIAFTPTLGIQLILAVFAATAVRANRAMALIMVWITNAFTAVPIYTFCYAVGRRFTGGPGVRGVSEQLAHTFRRVEAYEFWELFDRVTQLLKLSGEVLLPLTVGGIIVGLVAAAPAYVLALLLVRLARAVFGHHHATPTAQPQPGEQAPRQAA